MDLHGEERHHGSSFLREKAHQSAFFVFRRRRSYLGRRHFTSRADFRIKLTGLLYRYAPAHSHWDGIAPAHLRWHEQQRIARQSDLHAFRRWVGHFWDRRAIWRDDRRPALRTRHVATRTRQQAHSAKITNKAAHTCPCIAGYCTAATFKT